MSKKIYIVTYSVGQYEDRYDDNVCAFENRDDAVAYVREKESWQEKIEELAIKDDNSYRWDDSDENDEYSKLYNEFSDYIWREMFGDRESNDLTDEEWEKYNDYDFTEGMKKYMVEAKGYTQEVADATAIYNESNDWGEFHYVYSIDEVELFEKKGDK